MLAGDVAGAVGVAAHAHVAPVGRPLYGGFTWVDMPEAYSRHMGKYGSEIPEGDDRPPEMHDPFEYEDNFMDQVRNGRSNPLIGGWTLSGGPMNSGLGIDSVVALAGLVIRGVFLLVRWPVRWVWRRR